MIGGVTTIINSAITNNQQPGSSNQQPPNYIQQNSIQQQVGSSSNSVYASGKGATSVAPLICAPGFSYVEETIARCWRIGDIHIPFLRANSIRSIVNVSGDDLDDSTQYFCQQEAGIAVHNLFSSGPSPLNQSVSTMEVFVKRALELILQLTLSASTVLIVGSEYNIDSVIVACLRRVQEWSFVSIVGEFRMNSGCRHFDVEQFIENFDHDEVDISQNTPEFLQVHFRIKEEEIKLLQRLELLSSSTTSAAAAMASSSGKQQKGVLGSEGADGNTDIALGKIFFSNKTLALSPGSVYDPSVSLINDKDDDD